MLLAGHLILPSPTAANNILAASAGPHRVVVFGDTSSFENAGFSVTSIERADNRTLIINIANFTAAPEPSTCCLVTFGYVVIVCHRRGRYRLSTRNLVKST